MASRVVTRTYRASICNYSQVRDDLDSLGVVASKLCNVGQMRSGILAIQGGEDVKKGVHRKRGRFTVREGRLYISGTLM